MINLDNKKILDVTCGSRTIWFNKQHPNTVYCDKRELHESGVFGKQRSSVHTLDVSPDVICDFTALPFPDNTFSLVVFDPPHLLKANETAWLVRKYGNLDDNWPKMIGGGTGSVCAFLNRTVCLSSNGANATFPLRMSGKPSGRNHSSVTIPERSPRPSGRAS